ncbi:MAG: aminotransferase class I/II-fold pyridoxal phosphate-dependent enzyme [Clostridia bacterium]|nr:aminotransferase class I/II-fold pyridoxal phosphate-dependent enzyme [Clostridia bacterium]
MKEFRPETQLNDTLTSLPPSGIRRLFDIASKIDGVISLGIGEPDFITPWHIRNAGIRSLEKGKTQYTANSGLAELRREVTVYMKRRFGLEYTEKNVLITVGGSEAIDLAMRAFIKPGDEVIVPQPSFVCYGPLAKLCGAKPVYIQLKEEDGFKLTPAALKAAITEKTKLLVLPFPNNPTGSTLTGAELEAIAEVIRDTKIIVLSDEIYAELTYTGQRHRSIASLPGMKERTVIVSGFSKAYAMTGWRLGYALAPEHVCAALTKLHQYAIMCAPTASQYAAIEALSAGDEDIEEMRREYNYRRRLIVKGFNDLGLKCTEPEGALYCFPNITSSGLGSEDFCEQLLSEEKIALVPGNAFGESGEGFVRASYAYSADHIKKALEGVARFLEKRKGANRL